jgi:monoterpene epsilon-lactone hydrolase
MHGGGYVCGSADAYRSIGAALSRAAGARVLLLDYRLAPEHPYPAALDDATFAYRWLCEQGVAPEEIVIGGDSAGGGLALSTIHALRDMVDRPPAGAIAVSPIADQTFSGESMTSRADVDPITSREMLEGLCAHYRGEADTKDPYLSPLFGDFARLPPLLVLVGTDEVLYDDAIRVVDKARNAGGKVRLLIGQDQNHLWPLFADLPPEGQPAIEEIGRFVKRVTGGSSGLVAAGANRRAASLSELYGFEQVETSAPLREEG